MGNRCDFPQSVKDLLCIGVSGHCSICGECTTWVNDDNNKKTNVGEAAHIEAASVGGPRYNPNQTEEQRSSYENGIWLCSNCHSKVDKDETKYTVDILRCYKNNAIMQARKNARELLEGKKNIGVADFGRTMLSLYSTLYSCQESIHEYITKLYKFSDAFFQEYRVANTFYTELSADIELRTHTIFPILSSIRSKLWGTRIPPLLNCIQEGRLYLTSSHEMEQNYLNIIGNCPVSDEEWWNFFIRIKDKYEEMNTLNTKLLTIYKEQFDLFYVDIAKENK